MRTLWGLLIVLCLAMPVAGALEEAKLARKGFLGYALALIIGLALGVAFAYALRKLGRLALLRTRERRAPAKGVYFSVVYFGAFAWVVFALFAGAWASSHFLRLIS